MALIVFAIREEYSRVKALRDDLSDINSLIIFYSSLCQLRFDQLVKQV